ncbi:protein kinase [Actinoallomurus spadix]|uniref:non-specific serine/threonine protein kinase n=1 Tax=Actinoallomurus spadix TaxID=79912 RepID=A0ABP3HDL5_9ACTN|nr:serine/threonine-protein kinase [Actinoallomurus spadix]MCO5985206.1 protein kinase [Actinoallomurus spadix]
MSIPSTVGRYRIDRVLGAGAFASVWLARDELLDAPVAVKVLAGGLIDDLDVRNRFLEEAKILRRADSERLVRVHDIGELEDGRPYFVMSYADGGTLEDRMRNRRLTVAEVLRLAIEIAHGVEVINRLGVIHRDLKPSNILFQSTTDGGERLLIADLGLAKALAHASGAFTMPVGTPGYMSPEQARFGGGLDVRADVYGLGALTYHLLTGDAPGPAPVQSPPSAARGDLPPAVDEIVMRALEGDRERRWPSAEAFAAALSVPLMSVAGDATVRDEPGSDATMLDPGTGEWAPGGSYGAGPVDRTGDEGSGRTLRVSPVPDDPPEPGGGEDSPSSRTLRVPPVGDDPGPAASDARGPAPYDNARDRTIQTPPPAEGGNATVVDLPIERPYGPGGAGGDRPAAGPGARPGGTGGGSPGGPSRKRLVVIAGLAAVLVVGGGGAYAIGKLTGGSSSKTKPGDGLVTVSDVAGRLSIRVPPSWVLQRQHTTWPVAVADRAKAPALRATPDYGQFVKDDVPTPGVFAGLTHDLNVTLPPRTLGSHRAKCTPGAPQAYHHGTLAGQITPWHCGTITINETGLRDTKGKYAMWVRVKITGSPDLTRKILDSIQVKG